MRETSIAPAGARRPSSRTAEHEREADEAHRSNALHEVPGILRYDLAESTGERKGLAGSLKSTMKEILRLQTMISLMAPKLSWRICACSMAERDCV